MKIVFCAALAVATIAPVALLAAEPETAYQALRTVSAQRGGDILKHVIEVTGQGGVPEPVAWRVILDDPTARGGVRELDVAHGKIVAEHTPMRQYSGSAAGALIDFHKLNLDSSGAFTVTEKEAQKAHLGFDSVDYTLRTGDGPDANPIWVIHLMDPAHHSVGSMSVGADTGAIVSSDLYSHHEQAPYVASQTAPPPPPPPASYQTQQVDHDNLYTPPADEPPPQRQADDNDTEDTQGLRIGHRIKQAFISAGVSLKNFVTGQSASSDH
ncbi:MAG TPA: hypothetical protein VHY22_04290 [Chthoniobacteraceae bacterium]|jgi:hypothetical protein|nr:hypothetical protein [Chthoniobacteraceae bacterium]